MTSPPRRTTRWRTAQKILDAMPNRPEIRHGESLNPCYMGALDLVVMPNMGQFEDAERYFSTIYHELVHSTGHKCRLNRFEKRAGESREEGYGFEELVAELVPRSFAGRAASIIPRGLTMRAPTFMDG